MNNLYILTEERAKNEVLKQIIDLYSNKFSKSVEYEDIDIIPQIKNNKHTFFYDVKGISIEGIDNIYLSLVSGDSSFVDFLVFEQENTPNENNLDSNNLLMLIEETKTTDSESRNTGVYQRSSKFVYAEYHYPNIPKIMLYNMESQRRNRKPTDTNIFGTNLLLTQDVEIIGKDEDLKYFKRFDTVDELIEFKENMARPPSAENVPITIVRKGNVIEVSGRLSNPKEKYNIGHDPNIGSLTSISNALRVLGWKGRIIITNHGVKQEVVNNMRSNKFLKIATILDIELENIYFDKQPLPKKYWHYEMAGEKVGTIFLHLLSVRLEDVESIYQNHAGSERGYFYAHDMPITLPKKDRHNNKLYIPDLILKNSTTKEILLIEGKKSSTVDQGFEELDNYDSIEEEFIKKYYPDYEISRWVVTFGDKRHRNVLFHLFTSGDFYINEKAPDWLKELLVNN